ncbi:MAG: hypothetical protein KME27_02950 [Lyngbya sp. HA4199-MV5]|jgi:hypothetical protein|nr:hypothetical protein [Lyngbya sp. HA4199-MV5]
MMWLISTWIAGTAAILGSLMVLGSLILLVAPTQPRLRTPQQAANSDTPWSQRLKLLGVSLVMALAGLGILLAVPFPTAQ